MKSHDALRVLAGLTASQWGMITAAQAVAHGVSRLQLSRLTESGQFMRIGQGVYMDAGVPRGQFDELRAAWLSTEPAVMAEQRVLDLHDGVVVASSSAAYLHGVGDLWADRHEFVSPRRRQTERKELRYRQRLLEPQDVTIVEGVPTMTVERTIADLVDDVGDLSLVADVLRDAETQRSLDYGRLRVLLSPLAARSGFKKDKGNALLDLLMKQAGIDVESRARRIAKDAALSTRVVSKYLEELSQKAAEQLTKSQEFQKALEPLQEQLVEVFRETLSKHVDSYEVDGESVGSQLSVARIAANVSKQVGTDWIRSLMPAENSPIRSTSPSGSDGAERDYV